MGNYAWDNAKRKKEAKQKREQRYLNERDALKEKKQESIDELIDLQEDADERERNRREKQHYNNINRIINSALFDYNLQHPQEAYQEKAKRAKEKEENEKEFAKNK